MAVPAAAAVVQTGVASGVAIGPLYCDPAADNGSGWVARLAAPGLRAVPG